MAPRSSSWPRMVAEQTITWRQLDLRSNQLAHVFAQRGLGVGDRLAVCLRNSLEHLLAGFAGWKVGATVVPVRWDLPEWERNRLLAVLRPASCSTPTSSTWSTPAGRRPDTPLPEVVSPHGLGGVQLGFDRNPQGHRAEGPGRLPASTNVTSTVVASYGPMSPSQLVLCPAPIYHTNGFTAFRTLLGGDPIVLMERFKAPLVLDLIERHRITGFIAATPMLQRMAQVPGIEDRDLSSLSWVQQGASPLPVWLGHFWIDLVGAEHFYMSYGASESIGIVVCRGDQWLAHPGTLGRGMGETEIPILGARGQPLPPGEVGGIYLRTPTGPLADYVGRDVTPMDTTADGFTSVGDLGWLDEDGLPLHGRPPGGHDRHRWRQRLPGRGRGGPERAPRHRRRGGGRTAGSGVGPSGARHRAVRRPPARRRRGHRLRPGPPGPLQGAQVGGVRGVHPPQRGHEVQPGRPGGRAGGQPSCGSGCRTAERTR